MTDLDHPATVEVAFVSRKYLDNVEKANNNLKFMPIGSFDPVYLSDFVEMILRDSPGEIELLCMPIPNQRGAPMLVARYDGEYIALAGLTDMMKKCD